MSGTSSALDRDEADHIEGRGCGPFFATTHWTVVLQAGRSDTTRARAALEKLCQTYWYPLYAYVRRRGYTAHDAQDLTQEFLARLLEKNRIESVTRERGRFRSFLLTALKHFLVDEWKKGMAQKRGGGLVISLDAADAETRFGMEPVCATTPELLYDRNWALALLDAVYLRLEREYCADGKSEVFRALKFCLAGTRSSVAYAELAARLGATENTVKTWVRRLRRRYRELLRGEVAHSLSSPADVEEELRSLFRALAGGL